ncbi:hypothetical protein [Alicyclobacillus dauci]|uniref:Uncharacterized protein n=1 Tax=Alicyclobacillus dauci TaxID=1475485 RepID=A0ABY6Z150_9BACL|nr:hypothetical protein [Alicyclobacillus dauci]WAH36258.1 hypothetical protein NZD86_18780 [Alicyclobacillus dauci]WAH39420.1 hypothetical protein NZD86_23240 [Alicyclobacillus dauci]
MTPEERSRLIVEAEERALATMTDENQIEATFQCPDCGGKAHISLHEWAGYTSSCENNCF